MTGEIEVLERPDAPPIDPRIRARRIAVQRTVGRRRLQRLLDVALVLGVALVFFGALWTPLLDVDEVRVEGAAHLSVDDVLAASGVVRGDPLIGVDLGDVGRRVTALAWVKEVRVDRGIDGVVTLVVTERVPVATVEAPGGAVAVDVEGRTLALATTVPGPLPALVGAEAPAATAAFMPGGHDDALHLAARLVADAPGAFASIEVDGLVAHLAQGGAVRFGDATQLEAKLRSLRTMLDQVDLTCLAVIDLRLPSSAVLTREEGCS